MTSAAGFKLPQFFGYPPYFTLQPVKETQEKQISLWHDLLLSYCKHHKIYIIPARAASGFALFSNDAIKRSLDQNAINAILGSAVASGRAAWVDDTKQECIILWRSLEEWGNIMLSFAQSTGQSDLIMTVDEVSTGIETKGTDLEGVHKEVIVRAVQRLEAIGKARLFKGEAGDDDGIKFFV